MTLSIDDRFRYVTSDVPKLTCYGKQKKMDVAPFCIRCIYAYGAELTHLLTHTLRLKTKCVQKFFEPQLERHEKKNRSTVSKWYHTLDNNLTVDSVCDVKHFFYFIYLFKMC